MGYVHLVKLILEHTRPKRGLSSESVAGVLLVTVAVVVGMGFGSDCKVAQQLEGHHNSPAIWPAMASNSMLMVTTPTT